MIWHYLRVVEAVADFETLLEASRPFLTALPKLSLPLLRGKYQIALVDWELPFDGTFDESRREILLWKSCSCLSLALAHELGHVVYAHGLRELERAGSIREVLEGTRAYQYLKETEETRWALALSQEGEPIEVQADAQEVEYLLRWDELFSRALAQYVAQISADGDMLREIENRSRPQRGAPFYPQH